MSDDMVWIPAVPLPLLGWRADRCFATGCGKRFRGKNRRWNYEIHYRREHQRGDTDTTAVQMQLPRAEAKRIYDAVNADLTEPPERTRR